MYLQALYFPHNPLHLPFQVEARHLSTNWVYRAWYTRPTKTIHHCIWISNFDILLEIITKLILEKYKTLPNSLMPLKIWGIIYFSSICFPLSFKPYYLVMIFWPLRINSTFVDICIQLLLLNPRLYAYSSLLNIHKCMNNFSTVTIHLFMFFLYHTGICKYMHDKKKPTMFASHLCQAWVFEIWEEMGNLHLWLVYFEIIKLTIIFFHSIF